MSTRTATKEDELAELNNQIRKGKIFVKWVYEDDWEWVVGDKHILSYWKIKVKPGYYLMMYSKYRAPLTEPVKYDGKCSCDFKTEEELRDYVENWYQNYLRKQIMED